MPTQNTTAPKAGARGHDVPPDWTVELEKALLQRLRHEWEQINWTHCGGELRSPVLRLVEADSFLARWDPETRHIEFSRAVLLRAPWPRLIEVLKHEMAHQYVSELLDVDETPHGPAFRGVCHKMGIEAGATMYIDGQGNNPASGDRPTAVKPRGESEKTIERVKKLMALAQSPEQHEAEAAAVQARKLMMRYNLSAAQLEVEASDGATQGYSVRHLGRATGRVQEHERRLAAIIGDYFFVEVLWIPVYRPLEGKRANILEVMGSHANLEMAEYVHAFLSQAAERLWTAHKRKSKIKANRDRLSFLAGVMKGFADKLARQDNELREAGLVWVPNPGLVDYQKRRYPYTRTIRHGGRVRNNAFESGTQAGSELVLSRPVESGAGSGGAPRALPKGRG